MDKKKSFWYWLGNTAVGLLGTAVYFSDAIIPEVFPEKTIAHKLAIPISYGIKYLWDSWKYRKGELHPTAEKLLDKLPNAITGKKGSLVKGELPSGLSKHNKK